MILRKRHGGGEKWYGVEIDVTVSSPVLTRIGSPRLHAILPIQSSMRRCLLLDNGTVNYYLDSADSTKKANGTAAVLDGTDGQVMVEIPAHYRKTFESGNKQQVMLSALPLSGFTRIPTYYVSAYEAALQRSTSKLASVVNTSTDYRGGDNNSGVDGAANTRLGRCATSISRTNFRTYGKNRGTNWICDWYAAQRAIYWLRAIEYANLDCQAAFNATLTSAGFRQGGLGNGVTTVNNGNWGTFNGYNPLVPCGATNSLGNKTGEVSYTITGFTGGNISVMVPSYRGLENPFGHIWSWCEGVNIINQSAGSGGQTLAYESPDIATLSDTVTTGYTAMAASLPRANNYMSRAVMGANADFLPTVASGSATTYYCDYFYAGTIPGSGTTLFGLFLGGNATGGSDAGLGFSYTFHGPSITYTNIGSRLCFLGV